MSTLYHSPQASRKPRWFVPAAVTTSDSEGTAAEKPQSTITNTQMDKTKLMQAAIRSSLNDGLFIDTKFYAFSRRRSTGVVDKPRPLYVNSNLIRGGSKDLGSLLGNDFKEAKLVQTLRGPFPTDRPSFTEDYYNDSDSDLEDDSDTEVHSGSKDGRSTSTLAETAESESRIARDEPHTQPISLDGTEHDNYGRVIVVPDVAFTTLRAFMLWLCTGDLAFSRLKSQTTRLGAFDVMASETFDCSPKSMYRLADKWGVQELQKKALGDIRSKLSRENIMHELLSFVTSTYPEVRDMEITFVLGSPRCKAVVLEALPGWLADVASGKSARTTDTLAAFVQRCVGLPSGAIKNDTSRKQNSIAKCGVCGEYELDPTKFYLQCTFCESYTSSTS
ncbi:hypothetical protein BC629DRAFT_1587220 [Irpex lacteus]|nr:hypothetical protein BC629DRAFT_1587220 [Irpex lacteus]